MDFTKWLPFQRQKSHADNTAMEFVAVCLLPDGAILAHAKKDKHQQLVLQRCDFFPKGHIREQDNAKWLTNIVNSYNVTGCEYRWVLLPDDYQLIMLDAPNAELTDDEKQQTLLWDIKEYINFPLTDAILDSCDIPEFGAARKRMIYTVIANETGLSPSLQLLHDSGIKPDIVDITEFALRNLANLYANKNESVVLVCVTEYYSLLLLINNNNLYFSRQLELQPQHLSDQYIIDNELQRDTEVAEPFYQLATDIQRSIEYFETQMAQPTPQSIIISPMPFQTDKLQTYLTSQFEMMVIFADLNQVMTTNQTLTPDIQLKCLPVLGGILRQEGEHHDAAN